MNERQPDNLTLNDWQRVRALFDAALEQPSPARAQWLRDVCQGDEVLFTEISQLLLAHEQSAGVLDETVVIEPTVPEVTGLQVGPYRLLREIGRGGMGIVYLAERADEVFEKQVAVKLVFPVWQTDEVMGRFDRERRVLAELNHPGIARLMDGGTTEAGWPYLVMEYVAGTPIDEYCDAQQLAITERLRLFQQVCLAVEHAHERRIIHRDLKPSNILVSAAGEPRLLDFGIAKILGPARDDLHASGFLTRSALHFLTPEYSSPEQLHNAEVTPASDVYSLGVLLYELLTGHRPYRLRSPLLHEVVRAVTEEDPEPPGRAVDRVVTETDVDGQVQTRRNAAIVSRARAVSPAQLRERLRGDLDNIALLALRRNAADRYQTVAALREDLERHLNHEPVQARGASWSYRAGRFVRRHRLAAINTMLLLVLLTGGLIYAAWQSRQARAQAQQQRREQYAVTMNQALQDYQRHELKLMNEKLRGLMPQSGEEDLRGFEWRYLWRLGHRELAQLQHQGFAGSGSFGATFSEDGKELVTYAPGGGHLWDTTTWQEISFGIRGEQLPGNWVLGPENRWWRLAAVQESVHKIVVKSRDGQVTATIHDPEHQLLNPYWIDENRIVTGSEDGQIRVWDARGGTLKLTLPPIQEDFSSASLPFAEKSLSEKMLASYVNGNLRLWDLTTGRLIYTIRRPAVLSSLILNRKLLLALSGSQLKVYDGETGRYQATLTGHLELVKSIDSSPHSRLVATASQDRTIRLWSTETWREVAVLRGHTDWLYRVRFSPDGRLLASVSSDRTLRLWDVATRRELAVIPHADEVHEVVWSPDQQVVVTMSRDRIARVWRVADLLAPEVLRGHTSWIFNVAVSPDGQRIATASNDRTVRLWNLADGSSQVLRGHTDQVFSVAFSPDGKRLVSGGVDSRLRLWGVSTGRELNQFRVLGSEGTEPDRENPNEVLGRRSEMNAIRAIAFSSDGSKLAIGGNFWREGIKLRDATTGQLLRTLKGHEYEVLSVSFSPDGSRLVTSASDRTARVWDVATGRLLATLSGHREWVWSAKFSPDGRTIATGSMDQTVKLWDATTFQELATLHGHTDEVFSVAFSPDGTRLATASNDKTIRLWNLATRQEALTLRDHTEQVWSVAFSADGQTLVSGSWDGTARIYRAATQAEVSAFNQRARR